MYSCKNSCSFVGGALEGMFIDARGKLPIMLNITPAYIHAVRYISVCMLWRSVRHMGI